MTITLTIQFSDPQFLQTTSAMLSALFGFGSFAVNLLMYRKRS